MSQEDINLVRSAFDAWNRGELEAFAELVAKDVAWIEVSGRPEEGTELLGRDRLRQSLESLLEAWESYRLEVEGMYDVGDRVVALVREVARGRSSGIEIDGRWGYVITVGNGRIVRVEAHRNADLALQAVGLGEGGPAPKLRDP